MGRSRLGAPRATIPAVKGVRAARWVRVALVAVVAVALTGAVASASSHRRRPGCGRSCRQLGGVGGTMGVCDQTMNYAGSAVADARTLKIKITGPYPSTGDLLLAVVASDHGQVSPPSGWKTFSSASGTGGGVQIFYEIAGQRVAPTYTFTSAGSQQMDGALLDAMGVSAHTPFEGSTAGAGVSGGDTVTAPSITPSSRHSLLVFVGSVASKVKWTAPKGMSPIYLDPYQQQSASRVGIAIQRWGPASATGDRKARISRPEANAGELLALHYPAPITCPHVKVLSRHFQPNSRGIMSVKMKCNWTARCQGAFEGVDLEDHFPTPKIAASDFTIPAGQTRSVPIATTRAGFRALKQHGRLKFDIFVWAFTAAHQIVIAGADRSVITAPGT